MSDALSGRTARKQYTLAREAQAEQRAQLAKQRGDLDAIEAGQKRLRQGGGGGLLAFLDGEDRDPESGLLHTAHIAWHGLALTAFLLRGVGTDDRAPR